METEAHTHTQQKEKKKRKRKLKKQEVHTDTHTHKKKKELNEEKVTFSTLSVRISYIFSFIFFLSMNTFYHRFMQRKKKCFLGLFCVVCLL